LAYEIISRALEHGVNCFDTAQAYGNGEFVLGRALRYREAEPDIKVISKLSPDLQLTDSKAVEQSIKTSCQNLGVNQLWCLMLHRADQLDFWDQGLGQVLSDVAKRGCIKHVGVSVYELKRPAEPYSIPIFRLFRYHAISGTNRCLMKGFRLG